jgi:hypothetical protein
LRERGQGEPIWTKGQTLWYSTRYSIIPLRLKVCVVGYNDFNFFDKMVPLTTKMDVKWNSKKHFLKNMIFFFSAVSSAFGFKVS